MGFLAAVPVFQRKGWFFEDVIRVPEAPNGSVELLIHTAMEDAREQGDAYVTLGVSPLRGLTDEAGPHPRTRRLLECLGERLGFLYDFGGLEACHEPCFSFLGPHSV